MRNPEAIKLSTICGIKPENLTEEVVSNVRNVWADITGSEIENPWIFHSSRIRTELSYGREKLAVTLGTKRGTMTLSVKKDGRLLVFNLDTIKEEKPVSLHPFYTDMEQQFDQKLTAAFKEQGVLQQTVYF